MNAPHPLPARTLSASISLEGPPREFQNRELSWLAFNHRVLREAQDARTPLLERVRFLAIFTANLDEFFMKRVGGLKRQVLAGVTSLSLDKASPTQQLSAIRTAVTQLLREQAACYQQDILPALREQGIQLLTWPELTEAERHWLRGVFYDRIFPALTPMAVDPGHPFPLLSNLSTSLGITLRAPEGEQRLFARVKVPPVLPRWLRLEVDPQPHLHRYVSLMEIITQNLDQLFPKMQVLSVTPFRVTRNADVERDEEDSEDLLELIEQELRERRFAGMVRLEHGPAPDPWTLDFLRQELELSEQDVYEMRAELDFSGLLPLADLDLPRLKYDVYTPVIPPRLADLDIDMFSVIRAGDMLVHHPYESFADSVERFIRTAADDPKVLAIKVTLYRVGDSRSLMSSLIGAAESGKQVACLVELKARFDEQRNIFWAHQLERAGVHVVYGIVGLKTHCKMALVVRQDSDALRCYVHLGTGNYNVVTARVYTDLGLFTCRKEITAEVVEMFHYLTGRSLKDDYAHLLVAPVNMRRSFMELIEREMENCRAGRPARILAKMNSLEDRAIIEQLYRASQAGVPIDLIVRGFCCLTPGVPGLSENIRVTSVVGRFLEHSRIFYFRNGAEEEIDGRFFIGSADWMYRNLSARVEAVVPVEERNCRQRLWQLLEILLADQRQAWDMHPDGTYTQRWPVDAQAQPGTHATLMHIARQTGVDPRAFRREAGGS